LNSLITILTLWQVYLLWGKERGLTPPTLRKIQLGAALPLLDILTYLQSGELSLSLTPMWFHSFWYQGLLWACVASLHWVLFRNAARALRWFWPLAGLAAYAVVTLFSTEQVQFLHPFTDAQYAAGWVFKGYLFPLLFSLLLLATRRWSAMKLDAVCKSGLVFLAVFTFSQGLLKGVLWLRPPLGLKGAGEYRVQAMNLAQTEWLVSLRDNGELKYSSFFLLGGFEDHLHIKPLSNDKDLLTSQLLDPVMAKLYHLEFTNPLVNLEFDQERLVVTLTEMIPLDGPMWTQKIQLVKNAQGQTLEFKRELASFF